MKVAVVAVDQVVCGEIYAWTSTKYLPASESTPDAENVIVLPDTVISEGLGPVTVNL
jgi:hypothetical protein